MKQALRVLLVEDSTADADLILRALHEAGFEPDWTRVDTEEAYLASLDPGLDVILSDYSMPQFDGPRALELLGQSGLDVPFLTISGTIGEDVAVESMKLGASDYLLKDRLSRLGQSVRQSMDRRRLGRERQRAEEALRESEERLKLALASSRMGVWEWDVQTGSVFWSPECLGILGIGGLDGTIEAFARWMHPDDAVRAALSWKEALAGLSVYQAEFRILRPDGELRWLANIGRARTNQMGRPLGMVGTMQDITERRLADERIAEQAALLDKAQDAILLRDLERRVVFWNQGAERLYGWTAGEVVGRDTSTFLYPVQEQLDPVMKLVIEKGEWRGELQHLTKAGHEVTVESHWTLVRDAGGSPKTILSINTDITEKKKLEAQFLRAQRMESIGTLAGGIAHDLNNVLTPIMMSIDLLKMRVKDSASLETLDTIAASARRGAAMVSQVLSFARGAEGARMEVRVAPLIDDLVKISADSFPRNIRFKTSCDPALWSVIGDPTQLHQVLLNLCINARDAMPAGGCISITAENLAMDEHYAVMKYEAKAGPWVVVHMADTGTGIPPEIIDRIFDPFFTTKGVGQGTGLGLSCSLAIVKSHGGFIRVESKPGKGTQFDLYLPAETASAEMQPAPAQTTPVCGNGELVLVIDDECDVREITRQTLEAFGYRVLLATDGAEAVELFARHEEVVVVLTDMMMPVMDGLATIQVLLRMAPSLPIIAASGLTTNGSLATATGLGIKHFLAKPFTGEALLSLLHQVLRKD